MKTKKPKKENLNGLLEQPLGADSQVSPDTQNTGHNVKKESLGPNTKR